MKKPTKKEQDMFAQARATTLLSVLFGLYPDLRKQIDDASKAGAEAEQTTKPRPSRRKGPAKGGNPDPGLTARIGPPRYVPGDAQYVPGDAPRRKSVRSGPATKASGRGKR